MKIKRVISGAVVVILAAGSLALSAPKTSPVHGPTQMVITVRQAAGDDRPVALQATDLTLLRGNTPAQVLELQRLAGDLADLQLFVLLDDSTRSASLGTHLRELKSFLESLPATTRVAVGYMRNGTFGQVQAFTADHQKAAAALRLPAAIPGENGSPYFALSDLAKRWPSKESTDRRVVLMLTDGIDRYYSAATMDDPYVNTAIRDSLKAGVMVYPIYLRGAGDGRNGWATNIAQSHLMDVSQETGGYAYFEGFSDPVTLSPFLKDFQDRLANQYRVTVGPLSEKGMQPVKLQTDPRLKIEYPTYIYAW